jgi:hypothetical protein
MVDCSWRHAYSSSHARQQENDVEYDKSESDLRNELVPPEVLAQRDQRRKMTRGTQRANIQNQNKMRALDFNRILTDLYHFISPIPFNTSLSHL